MRARIVALSIFLALSNIPLPSALAGEIHLSAAASLKDAFLQIIQEFRKTKPETVILTNFGASGSLAKQIVQGAPADIFVSADVKWLEYLIHEGKGLAATQRTLVCNRLVFIGKKGLAVDSLADLKGLERIAIGSPTSVPAGQYAEQAMQAAGIYQDLAQKKQLVMAQDVRQALLYADRGEVDGAFVYKTDALLARHAVILFTVTENLHDRITYPMVLTRTGANGQELQAFFAYLGGPEAQKILLHLGFETAD